MQVTGVTNWVDKQCTMLRVADWMGSMGVERDGGRLMSKAAVRNSNLILPSWTFFGSNDVTLIDFHTQ